MGSTRLPGKVLMDLAGDTVLARVTERLRRTRSLHRVAVATSIAGADDAVAKECQRLGVEVFRGSESDVLARYSRAGRAFSADAAVRITADCPLIDPEIVDRTVQAFLKQKPDYASNVLVRTYPRGLDTEVFTLDAIERADREATKPYEREHVTPYLYEHPELFRLHSVTGDKNLANLRWTLDTPEDLEFVRSVYSRLPRSDFSWMDVLGLIEKEPGLLSLNAGVQQKSMPQV